MVWPSRAGRDPCEGDEVEEAGVAAEEIERWRRVRVDESDAYGCRDSTDHASAAASLATRGIALRQQGRLGEAMSLYDRALDLFQATAQAEDTAQAQAQAQAEAEAQAATRGAHKLVDRAARDRAARAASAEYAPSAAERPRRVSFGEAEDMARGGGKQRRVSFGDEVEPALTRTLHFNPKPKPKPNPKP